MPVILPEEHHDSWLSGGPNEGVANDARVISSKNNHAEIIASIELNTWRDLVSDPRIGTLLWWKKTHAVPLPSGIFSRGDSKTQTQYLTKKHPPDEFNFPTECRFAC
jgi:hypothetical protein